VKNKKAQSEVKVAVLSRPFNQSEVLKVRGWNESLSGKRTVVTEPVGPEDFAEEGFYAFRTWDGVYTRMGLVALVRVDGTGRGRQVAEFALNGWERKACDKLPKLAAEATLREDWEAQSRKQLYRNESVATG
jgi:hypothetical protein